MSFNQSTNNMKLSYKYMRASCKFELLQCSMAWKQWWSERRNEPLILQLTLSSVKKFPNSKTARVTLHKSLVRSKMDDSCRVWFPTTKEEISALEGIQKSCTSRIQSLKGLSYWERLRKLNLMSVQRRRDQSATLLSTCVRSAQELH